MLGIQKQFIKNYLGLNVISNKPGVLTIRVNGLNKVDEELRNYEPYFEETIKLLEGIEGADVDYDKDVVTITYNPLILTPQKVYRWIGITADVVIDKMDYIKANWEDDLMGVVNILQTELKKKL
ncbi:MAG: hypothetical protein AB9856_12225 [Cellulosilyticaceae bacterium]